MICIAMVAGELSGDYLAANLIRALRSHNLRFKVVGICGPNMIREGAQALYTIDNISTIGFEGLMTKAVRILAIRMKLINTLLDEIKPDIYIGVDAPDFNLNVEKQLREAGIPTVQYVAPTIWAWRKYRIHTIKTAVSRLLTIYPFESELYQKSDVPYAYVGHPLADEIGKRKPRQTRHQFGYNRRDTVIAILPGSRMTEVRHLAPVFIETAHKLSKNYRNLKFISPLTSDPIYRHFENILKETAPKLPIQLVNGNSLDVIAAADVVLLASGTAALEAALSRKPVVVAYKVSQISYLFIRLLGHVKHYCVLNHLSRSPVIPEFMQSNCTVENLCMELKRFLNDSQYTDSVLQKFDEITQELKCGANRRAAAEVVDVLMS